MLCLSVWPQKEKEKRVTDGVAQSLFRDVAGAVAFLHREKWSHRDLKCENVLLDADGSALLCDFDYVLRLPQKRLLSGCRANFRSRRAMPSEPAEPTEPTEPAEEQSEVNGSGAAETEFNPNLCRSDCGSPEYSPPEVLESSMTGRGRGGCQYDPFAKDVWSLGCILYRMVIGKVPFPDPGGWGNYQSMLRRQKERRVDFPQFAGRQYNPLCFDLLLELLHPTAARRPTARAALEHPWLCCDRRDTSD